MGREGEPVTAMTTATPAKKTGAMVTRSGKEAGAPAPAAGRQAGAGWVSRVEWSWRHGPVIGPVNAVGAAAGTAMVGSLAGVSPWWAAGAGLAAAGTVAARAAQRGVSRAGVVYRGCCWAGAGAWTGWALATSPWSVDTLAGLAVGGLVAGLGGAELSDHEQRVTARRAQAVEAARVAEEAARVAAGEEAVAAARVEVALVWEARLARVAQLSGVVVEGVQEWPSGAGYSLQVRLPQGGATWRNIASCVDGLAADADLPHGCGVEVAPGPSRQVAILQVATVDTTAVPQPYPDDTSELSYAQPLPIGMLRASRVAHVELLDDPALIVARIGSGKSNLLQVINADLVRCTDALIWHIDLNGAGMSRPWLTPWLRGTTGRPVIDWVASTAQEAEVMLTAAISIAKRRKTAYSALMDSVNDDKIPISPQVPAIVIVLDEGAEVVAANRGQKTLATKLDELISTARASRVQVVASALRATAEILPTSIKAMAGTRLFLRPTDEHEVAQLLGWRTGVSLDDVSTPGSGLLRAAGSAAVMPVRVWRMAPAQIAALTVAAGGLRPRLDPASSAAAAGPAYSNRWNRYLAWYKSQGGNPMPQHIPGNTDDAAGSHTTRPTTSANPAATSPRTPADTTGQASEQLTGMAALGPAYDALQADLARLREVREAAERRRAERAAQAGGHPAPTTPDTPAGNDADVDDGDVAQAFAAIISGWDDAPVAEAGQEEVDGPVRMLAVLSQSGSDGLHWQQLLDALTGAGVEVSRPTLYRWLNDAGDAVCQPRKGWWAITPKSDSQ